ncbi:trypsin-like peptidase domain-containing protein [Actinosynnema sp. NPDC020468]|uniref:S1C family serine protease n=1 Tax=Actinosynnema sp. NPDC020468 TaxID=3154488 RepID=UPI0033E02D29
MTENEPQPQQSNAPQESSPWARGSAPGQSHAGSQPQGAVESGSGEGGAVQGGAESPGNGAREAWQGVPAREETGSQSAVQGSAPRPEQSVAQGAWQGAPALPDSGSSATVQGGPGQPTGTPGPWQAFGGSDHHGQQQGAVQGGPARPDVTGGPGAPQGVPGLPGPFYAPPGHVPPPAPPKAKGRGKVVAGVAVLVLAVGGVAGGVGGYLGYQAADKSAPVSNALNAAPPAQRTQNSADGTIEAVAQKVLPTVVQVQLSGGTGSGIVISSDGLVLTNNHVVESAANGGAVKVQFQDGKTADATIVGRDPSSDLAVIKASGVSGLATAELGTSGDLKTGQQVVAIGSPFDLNGTVTSGIVSSLNRPVRAGGEQGSQSTVLNAIQTDAAINPGNSGGPLVNMQGQVVGINSAIYSPNSSQSTQGGSVGIGFAIPIDQARRTAKELSETGKATQTVLGVQVTDAQQGGAQVREVTSGGAAASAGLKAGDVITKFGDRTIDTSDALVAAVRSKAPGDKVQLTVGGKTVEVTLGSQTVETR